MQDALGADSTDLNWFAQPSSNNLATDIGQHPCLRISFAPLTHTTARCADARDGSSRARDSSRLPSRNCPLRDADAPRREMALSRRLVMGAADSGETARRRVLCDGRAVSRPVPPCARQAIRAIAAGEI